MIIHIGEHGSVCFTELTEQGIATIDDPASQANKGQWEPWGEWMHPDGASELIADFISENT
ncbi:hypothetical protein KA005_38145, partial [bacterium]|nr:hypothetical protein [bacterium]